MKNYLYEKWKEPWEKKENNKSNKEGTRRKINATVNKCGRIKESGREGKLEGTGRVELIDSPIPCGPVQA